MISVRIQEQAMMEDKQEWGCDCKTFKECNPQKKEKGSCCLFIGVKIEIESGEYREDQTVQSVTHLCKSKDLYMKCMIK